MDDQMRAIYTHKLNQEENLERAEKQIKHLAWMLKD